MHSYRIHFLLKIRKIFIFNIVFTAFIKILPVGEMPSHSHAMIYSSIQGTLSGAITGTSAGSNVGSNGVLNWQNGYELQLQLGGHGFVVAEPHIAADHTHSIIATGSNQSHNNLQPYTAIYMWQRIE